MGTLQTLVRAAGRLTTQMLPDDYLGLLNPLWATRERRARIEDVRAETRDAVTLELRPAGGWDGHLAGQFVRLGVDVDGVRHWRTYSVTSPALPLAGRRDGRLTVTVKAVPGGVVSNHLVRNARVSDVVSLDGPYGEFVLPTAATRPLLFVTAGSGITPVMGMLRTLAQTGMPDVLLVHSAPTPADVVFADELRALAAVHPSLVLDVRHTDTDGMFAFAELDELCADWRERDAWVCGPGPMLDAAESHWDGNKLLRLERFLPKLAPDPDARGGSVCFTRTKTTVEADGATPLLEAGESAGVLMPSGCRMGICHTCVVPLRSGLVRDLRTGEVYANDHIQTCVSAAAGPVELDL